MLEIVHVVLVSVSLTGQVKTTLIPSPSWDVCVQAVGEFTRTPLPAGVRDAHATCVRSPVNPLRGSRPA